MALTFSNTPFLSSHANSSLAHEGTVKGGIDFETLNDKTKSDTVTRYGRSKLANILFGKALARRLVNTQVRVNIAHPGIVDTELGRHAKETFGGFAARILDMVKGIMSMKPAVGALTQLYLATSPEVVEKDIRGRYFVPIAKEIRTSNYGQDEVLQEKLWTFTEKLVQEKVRS